MKSLLDMAEEVYQNNVNKGWYDDQRSFLEAMALLHTEVSEAVETWRDIGFEKRTDASGKPDDVGSELADVLIRLLDDCYRNGIDLEAEYERKMAFNRTRSYRHGNKRL